MNLLSVLAMGFFFEMIYMWVLWIVGKKINNAAIVDTGWSLSIVILAFIYSTLLNGYLPRVFLGLVMVFLWGIRLSLHIHQRSHGKGEDPRYTALKVKWGEKQDIKMLHFYWMQGLAALIFSLPFLYMNSGNSDRLHANEIAAFLLWTIAFVGETVADKQLEQFKSLEKSKGKTCRLGLWKYSRHPNYFFEWLIWCSFALYVVETPYGFIAILCPIAIYHFLVNVTGIPTAEAQALKSRGDDYRQYQATTSAFFPWFPKKS